MILGFPKGIMPLSNHGGAILRQRARFVKYHCVRNFLRAEWPSEAASSPLTIPETKRGESDFRGHSMTRAVSLLSWCNAQEGSVGRPIYKFPVFQLEYAL